MPFIVDRNMRKSCIENLKKIDNEIFFSKDCSWVYKPVNTHPDLQIHFADNDLAFVPPELFEYYRSILPDYIKIKIGNKSLGGTYPDNVAYNIARVGKYVVANIKYADEKILDYALKASRLFASWVYSYPVSFPGGTELEGINVCGGVIANVQNRHIGPGICTNSARFLYDLGKFLGDKRWIELYEQIKAAAINCVCTYEGEFFGSTFNEPFATGMVSEQINVSDAFNPHGFTWRVSASWPATNILLSWLDSPQEI